MNTATWVAIEHPYEAEMWETTDGGWAFFNDEGPWAGEPHAARVQTADMPALVLRDTFGVWCGHVGVPEGHWAWSLYLSLGVDVHGGLTFGSWDPVKDAVVGLPGADLWWLGFDCGHAGDSSPSLDYLLKKLGHEREQFWPEVYRTIDYAVEEVVHLARQLAREVP